MIIFDRIQCNEISCNNTAIVYETKFNNSKVYFCSECYLRKEKGKPLAHRSNNQAVKQQKYTSI